jgi:DNA repair protein RadC
MTAVLATRSTPPWRAARASWVRLVREGGPINQGSLRIRNAADVVALLNPRVALELGEVFYLIALDSQSQVLGVVEVTRGLANSSLVHPREVFRVAIALGALGVIVAHNHPSGDPTPSADDRAVTRQLVDAGRILDIPVYDHVVLGGERYVSFAEAGLL